MKWLFAVCQAVPGDLLRQPLRRRLMGIIRKQPGIHASEICRETGEAWGTVHYHLSLLQRGEMVTTVESGRQRQFYPPGIDENRARMLGIVTQGRREEIARFIHANPGRRQVDICNAISVSRKTFRSSVRALVDAGLIHEQRELQANRYFPVGDLESVVEADAFDLPDVQSDVGFA